MLRPDEPDDDAWTLARAAGVAASATTKTAAASAHRRRSLFAMACMTAIVGTTAHRILTGA
jgi:hypothetical protein